jgi:hypothetical protein
MDETYPAGEQFLVISVERDTPFTNPKDGEVIESRTKLLTRSFNPDTLEPYGLPVEVKTLGQVIYDHAGAQVAGDFPAICYWTQVDVDKWASKATILKRVAPWPLTEEMRGYMAKAPATE